MTSLQAHKRLLVLEAELQRGQFAADVSALRKELNEARRQIRSFGALAAVTAAAIAAISGLRRGGGHAPAKRSLISRLWSGAGFIISIWSTVRSALPAHSSRSA